jgi:hypothetical protein
MVHVMGLRMGPGPAARLGRIVSRVGGPAALPVQAVMQPRPAVLPPLSLAAMARALKCTLGWKILVRYRTLGGTSGYCSGTLMISSNVPPS